MKQTNAIKTYRIVLEFGVQKQLCKHFGVSDETIRKALRYMCPDNELHNRIRREAIENYGGQRIQVTKPINI